MSSFSWSHAPKVQLIELSLIFYLAGGSLLTLSGRKLGLFAPTENPQVVLCISHLQLKRGLSTGQETSQGTMQAATGAVKSLKGRWERLYTAA